MLDLAIRRPIPTRSPVLGRARAGGRRAAAATLLAAILLLTPGSWLPVQAQEVTLVAGGDMEWSRRVRGTNTYTLPNDNQVDMAVRGVRRPTSWLDLPLLNVPEHRQRIGELLGAGELDSPTGHAAVAIQYDLSFASAQEDVRHPFQRIRDLFVQADLAFANLEMPLSERARPTGAFVGPTAFADALSWAGMDVVSTANNHAFDGEELGLLDTMDALAEAGVAWVGTGRNLEEARRPVVVERGGIRIAFLGYARAINGVGASGFAQPHQSGVMPMDPLLIREDIRRVRDQVDYVAVSLHWAIENSKQTHPDARAFAYELIDAGADIILGHHPHVPRGVEIYDGRVIFYSLGNLFFGHGHDYWQDGYVARLSLTPERVTRVEIVPIAGRGTDMAQPYVLSGERARAVLEEVQALSEALDTPLRIEGDVGVLGPDTQDGGR